MATIIMTKKKFLDWCGAQLKDDQIILMTQDIDGELSVHKKRNSKRVPFSFAADCFKEQDCVGHIFKGQTPAVSFIVCDKEFASEDTIEMYNKLK